MNKEAKDEIKEDHGAFSDRRAYTFDWPDARETEAKIRKKEVRETKLKNRLRSPQSR